MSRYRKIDPRIWDDENFRGLSNDFKIAWLYILTGQSTNQIGLFRLSLPEMGESIGVDTAKARRSVAVLEERGMVVFDSKAKLIWVPKWIYYNEPSGSNQAKGYTEVAKEYLPHNFAKAFILLNHSLASSIPGHKAFLDKKQAILIRDDCRCSYCGEAIASWTEYELDHVVPAKTQPGDKYEDLVASCKSCNRKKGGGSAAEFGFPFVRGTSYSLREASVKLIFDKDLRSRFAKICSGLPPELAEIEHIENIINKAVKTPFERKINAVGTQEQEQEQEQKPDQEQEQDKKLIAPPGPADTAGAPRILFFACPYFDVDLEYRLKLAEEYPALNNDLLRKELSKMEDWISDNADKKKFKANGRLANPKLFIKNWLNRVGGIWGPKGPSAVQKWAEKGGGHG